MEGFQEFEARRKKKFDKQIDSNVMISSKGLDEGVDHWEYDIDIPETVSSEPKSQWSSSVCIVVAKERSLWLGGFIGCGSSKIFDITRIALCICPLSFSDLTINSVSVY